MAKQDAKAAKNEAPKKKKAPQEEMKSFSGAPRLKTKYNAEVAPALNGKVQLRKRYADSQAGEDRHQHGPRFRRITPRASSMPSSELSLISARRPSSPRRRNPSRTSRSAKA
jgi:hypothetical protein